MRCLRFGDGLAAALKCPGGEAVVFCWALKMTTAGFWLEI